MEKKAKKISPKEKGNAKSDLMYIPLEITIYVGCSDESENPITFEEFWRAEMMKANESYLLSMLNPDRKTALGSNYTKMQIVEMLESQIKEQAEKQEIIP